MSELRDEDEGVLARYSQREDKDFDRLYSAFEPAALMVLQQRNRVCIEELKAVGIESLRGLGILDVGCGSGLQLIRFMLLGALPEDLHGIDLVPARVVAARRLHPSIDVVEGSATALPWPDGSFDLVSQFTTFTSILDPRARAAAAHEITRVLRPSGHILWYDFWLNPTNPQTRGIRPREIKALFPGFSGHFRRLTLAPPLARVLARRSHLAAALLQEIRPLQSHYLAILSTVPTGSG